MDRTCSSGERSSALRIRVRIVAIMEPFDSGLFSHGSDSAYYPPDCSRALFPTGIVLGYIDASVDDTMARALRNYSNAIPAAENEVGWSVSQAAGIRTTHSLIRR
jgi:hypothetical protein